MKYTQDSLVEEYQKSIKRLEETVYKYDPVHSSISTLKTYIEDFFVNEESNITKVYEQINSHKFLAGKIKSDLDPAILGDFTSYIKEVYDYTKKLVSVTDRVAMDIDVTCDKLKMVHESSLRKIDELFEKNKGLESDVKHTVDMMSWLVCLYDELGVEHGYIESIENDYLKNDKYIPIRKSVMSVLIGSILYFSYKYFGGMCDMYDALLVFCGLRAPSPINKQEKPKMF